MLSEFFSVLFHLGKYTITTPTPPQEQQTALHIASRLGDVDIVSILLQHGAAVDAVTKDSYTALHIAAKEGQEEVASLLLDQKANLTATTKVCNHLNQALLVFIEPSYLFVYFPLCVCRRDSHLFTWLLSTATLK